MSMLEDKERTAEIERKLESAKQDSIERGILEIQNELEKRKSYKVTSPFPQVYVLCLNMADGYCFHKPCIVASKGMGYRFVPGDVIDKPIDPEMLTRKIRTHVLQEVS